VSTPLLMPSDPLPVAARCSARHALWPWYSAEALNSYAATLLTSGCYWFAARVIHASPAQGLWLSAAWGAAYVFISLLAGKLTERWGPRTMIVRMICGTIVTTAGGLLVLGWPSIWALLLIMLLFNFTSSQLWPALESAITRSPGRLPLSSRIALYNLTWSATAFLGFLTVGTLANLWWGWVFVLPALASSCSVFIILRWAIPAALIGAQQVGDSAAADDPTAAAVQRARTLLHMAWIGNALAYVAINVLIPVIPTLTKVAGFGSLAAGAAIASLWPLSRTAGFGIAWYWKGWHFKVRWLLAAQATLTVCFALLLLRPNPLTLVCTQIVFGLATAFVYASSLYYAMHVSDGAGGHAGMHEALIGVGIAIGPAIGALAGTGSDSTTRIGGSVSLVLALGIGAMALLAVRRPQRNP